MKPPAVTILIVGVATLACFGCSTEHNVTRPPTQIVVRPVPVSPDSAVRVFEWGWNHRDLPASCDWLAGDFHFVFAPGDSAGNQFRDPPVGSGLIDLLGLVLTLSQLYEGGGAEPPADSISLRFQPTLLVLPDGRPGKDAKWHKQVATTYDLSVWTRAGSYHLVGDTRFFVVRGDSAVILPAMGQSPDSTRWFLEQWNDETVSIEGVSRLSGATGPLVPANWGQLLALYFPR